MRAGKHDALDSWQEWEEAAGEGWGLHRVYGEYCSHLLTQPKEVKIQEDARKPTAPAPAPAPSPAPGPAPPMVPETTIVLVPNDSMCMLPQGQGQTQGQAGQPDQ